MTAKASSFCILGALKQIEKKIDWLELYRIYTTYISSSTQECAVFSSISKFAKIKFSNLQKKNLPTKKRT